MAKQRQYLLEKAPTLHVYEGDGPVEVGRIVKIDNPNEVVSLIVFAKFNKTRSPYHIYGDEVIAGNKPIFAIIIDETYLRIFREKEKQFEAIAFHELGHKICGHLSNDYLRQFFPQLKTSEELTEAMRRERVSMVKRGAVPAMELEADTFACNEVGKHTMNMMLALLKEERLKRADDGAALAIKEFELRKRAIRKL